MLSAPNLSTPIYLFEEFLFFRQYNFHKQKLVLHRASMRAYADHLRKLGHTVHYIESDQLKTRASIEQFLVDHKCTAVAYTDVTDNWLERSLTHACKQHNIERTVYPSPLFLTTPEQLTSYAQSTNQPYAMQRFYQWQRKRLGILLEPDQKPTGGKWSYDTENRKKLPTNIKLPTPPHTPHNKYVTEAITYVERNFPNNVGTTTHFSYATTHQEAEQCLQDFLHHRLANFGPYEDAIDERSHTLFHSVLSPYLNIGLLDPAEVVSKTLAYAAAKQHHMPLASLEGFIRQVIGWREYMRFVYETQGTKIRNSNYFKAHKHLTPEYWTGSTGITPIDDTIKQLLDTAYTHHIPRLMVLGNWMNLCGIHPETVYEWFMELFIDAYDWVMVPNVYSMALYADGGLITTKPYISGSNYIRSMSHYKKDPPGTVGWSSRWDALYWYFIDRHYDKLEKENRLGFAGMQYKRLTPQQLEHYRNLAKQTIKQLTSNS